MDSGGGGLREQFALLFCAGEVAPASGNVQGTVRQMRSRQEGASGVGCVGNSSGREVLGWEGCWVLWKAWVVPATNASLWKRGFCPRQQYWLLCPCGILPSATGGNGGEGKCPQYYLRCTQPGERKGVATCWLHGLLMRPQDLSMGNSQIPPG